MNINFLRLFRKCFKKRKNLKEEFHEGELKPLDTINKYPFPCSLEEKGIHAYQLLFFTNREGASKTFDLINELFKCDIDGANASYEFFLEGQVGKVYFYVSNKFGAKIICLITKSIELISGLQSLNITPDAPWVCFPDIDPDSLGARQGNFEYWWDNLWLPFWDSLDTSEKKNYLLTNNAPVGWVQYLNFYEEYLRH